MGLKTKELLKGLPVEMRVWIADKTSISGFISYSLFYFTLK